MALVKVRTKASAANTNATSRSTVNIKTAVALDESLVKSQPNWGMLGPDGTTIPSPTQTRWVTEHGWPGAAASLVCTSAPCEPRTTAMMDVSSNSIAANNNPRHGWYP